MPNDRAESNRWLKVFLVRTMAPLAVAGLGQASHGQTTACCDPATGRVSTG